MAKSHLNHLLPSPPPFSPPQLSGVVSGVEWRVYLHAVNTYTDYLEHCNWRGKYGGGEGRSICLVVLFIQSGAEAIVSTSTFLPPLALR